MAGIDIQKKLSDEMATFNVMQKESQKLMELRRQLDAQLTENTVVKEELDILEDEAVVFKLIGPALLKQNLKESKDNVGNRIKFIAEEVKRNDELIKDIETKMEAQREVVQKLQAVMQGMQSQQAGQLAGKIAAK
jgi:prefoldin beta subunit